MKLLKILLATLIAGCLILLGYYFVWNFMASKRKVSIKSKLDSASFVNFSYDDFNITGYPNNININAENLKFNSKDTSSKIKIEVGDVLFKIYPFVLKEQAKIILPQSQFIFLDSKDETHQYKLQSDDINVAILNNELNLDLHNVKLFSVNDEKLLFKADKFYYTSFMNNANRIKLNLQNLEFYNGQIIESAYIDMEMSSLEQLDILTMILSYLTLKEEDLKEYTNDIVNYLVENKSVIKLNNIKLNRADSWFELDTKIKIDSRNRFSGKIELVSDRIATAENILKFLTANQRINLESISLIQRLLKQDKENVVRISGKMEKGFLYVFNERLVRIKPFINSVR